MGTPKTDPDYEHSEAALREKDGLSLIDRMARWLDGATDDTSAELMREAIEEINALHMALHHANSATQVAVATAREKDLIALREWAVNGWRSEVQFRPMVNIHRRSLDDCWRQVMRYAGLDPVEVVGPSHDDLLAAGTAEMARRDALGPWEDRA